MHIAGRVPPGDVEWSSSCLASTTPYNTPRTCVYILRDYGGTGGSSVHIIGRVHPRNSECSNVPFASTTSRKTPPTHFQSLQTYVEFREEFRVRRALLSGQSSSTTSCQMSRIRFIRLQEYVETEWKSVHITGDCSLRETQRTTFHRLQTYVRKGRNFMHMIGRVPTRKVERSNICPATTTSFTKERTRFHRMMQPAFFVRLQDYVRIWRRVVHSTVRIRARHSEGSNASLTSNTSVETPRARIGGLRGDPRGFHKHQWPRTNSWTTPRTGFQSLQTYVEIERSFVHATGRVHTRNVERGTTFCETPRPRSHRLRDYVEGGVPCTSLAAYLLAMFNDQRNAPVAQPRAGHHSLAETPTWKTTLRPGGVP